MSTDSTGTVHKPVPSNNPKLKLPVSIFDPSGKVRQWIISGRGVHVWRCIDLSSPNVGGLTFTPGDTHSAPSWRDEFAGTLTTLDQCAFYRRWRIVYRSNGDSQAAYKACERRVAHDETLTVNRDGKVVEIKHAQSVILVAFVPYDENDYWRAVRENETPRPMFGEDAYGGCSPKFSAWCVVDWICETEVKES